MAMEITKDFTVSKAKTQVKANASDIIMEALRNAFGDENVAMVRKPSNDGKGGGTNFIAAVVDSIVINDEVKPIAVGVTVAGKDPVERSTKSGVIEAFDFYDLKQNYDNWLAKAEAKKEAAAAKKAKALADKEDISQF